MLLPRLLHRKHRERSACDDGASRPPREPGRRSDRGVPRPRPARLAFAAARAARTAATA